MFQIYKKEPLFFIKAKRKVVLPLVSGAWNSDEIRKIRPLLREHILLKEQNLLCAYCEKEIDDNPINSNIDHFKTRNLFPQKTLDYDNLFVSCNTRGRCSSYKDDNVKYQGQYDNIVNPVIENPDDFFDYLLTGEIVPKNDKAKFTIEIFYLKHTSLVEERLQIAEALKYSCNDLSLDEIYEIFGNEFFSFIKNVYPKLKEE